MQPPVRPPALFVGREAEIARVQALLQKVPVVVICGVAGVGKSALAYRIAAAWPGPRIHRRIAAGQPLGALCDDLRRECAATGDLPEALDDPERLSALAARLDEAGTLVVLDDLHHLQRNEAEQLVGGLAQLLRKGRVIVTGRETLVRRADGPDRAEVRLGGIDEASARELWRALDELYGPTEGFEDARQAARGNPLLLRRAHAGGWMDSDPIAAAIERLSPDELLLAGALALSEIRLPVQALARLRGEGGVDAIQGLVRSLVLEIGADGNCTLHDLFRDAVRSGMSAQARRDLHAALADLIDPLPIDPVLKVREMVGHLLALDDYERASRYLLDHATQLVRSGAAGELLASVEAIPEEHRSVEVRLLHARTLVRRLDFRRAHQELLRLSRSTGGRVAQVQLALGTIAHLCGRIHEAEETMRPLTTDGDLPPAQRVRARVAFAYTLAFRGRGEEARRLLGSWSEADAGMQVSYAWALGFTWWVEERNQEAVDALSLASSMKESGLHEVGIRMLLADARARLGHFDDCDDALTAAEQTLEWKQDLRMRMEVRQHRTAISYERGNRFEAIGEWEQLIREADRVGAPSGRLWSQVWLARAWLVLGRRRAALVLLEAIDREARQLDAQHVVSAALRSSALDPIAQWNTPPQPPPPQAKRGDAARWHAWAALRAACRADSSEMTALLAAHERLATGEDYALDRAIGALARAARARVDDDQAEAERWKREAESQAAAGGADPDLIALLWKALADVRVLEWADGRASASLVRADAALEQRLAAAPLIVDGRTHQVRRGGEAVSLARRPILRRLLYSLARRIGEVQDKERLVAEVWQAGYDPRMHDNAMRVNVRYLRDLVEGLGLSIEFDEQGYRLRCDRRFVYVEPLAPI